MVLIGKSDPTLKSDWADLLSSTVIVVLSVVVVVSSSSCSLAKILNKGQSLVCNNKVSNGKISNQYIIFRFGVRTSFFHCLKVIWGRYPEVLYISKTNLCITSEAESLTFLGTHSVVRSHLPSRLEEKGSKSRDK